MAKIRVHELAKELNMKHKVFMDKLAEMNIHVRSHMSSLDEEDVLKIREQLGVALENASDNKPIVIRKKNKPQIIKKVESPTAKFEPSVQPQPKPKVEVVVRDVSVIPPSPEQPQVESPIVPEISAESIPSEETKSIKPEEPKILQDDNQTLVTPVEKEKIYEEPARIVKPVVIEKNHIVTEPIIAKGVEPFVAPEPVIEPVKTVEIGFIESGEPAKADESAIKSDKGAGPVELGEPVKPDESAIKSDKGAGPVELGEPVKPGDSAIKPDKGAGPVESGEPVKPDDSLIKSDTKPGEPREQEIPKPVEPTRSVEPEAIPFKKPKKLHHFDKEQKPFYKQNKPFKKFKKVKKETPAKIIKLPTPEEKTAFMKQVQPEKIEPPVVVEEPEKIVEPEVVIDEPIMVPIVKEFRKERDKEKDRNRSKDKDIDLDGESDRRKKKWKKSSFLADDEIEHDKRFFKKKISFKRKEVIEGDQLYDEIRKDRKIKKPAKAKPAPVEKTQITVPKAIKRRIKIDETIVLSDLAKRMGIKAGDMIAKLMTLGVMATVNQTIDFDTAALVASEFNYEVEKNVFEEDNVLKITKDDPSELIQRPPVVTIMGHVDHGKTSLLDVIRKTKITEIEAGGITQHIGAYYVSSENRQIVFLDTPGHEAFTAIRARGAKITDIVVLVVAADDGVMPQTIEAINHAKAANVPIIVAVNKIDKPNADIDRVYRQLADHGLVPEEWGGDTIYVHVSAKQNIGIDNLLDMIMLQAEVLELKANPNKNAMGYVVEAKLDSGRGAVATVLIKEGTLHVGDPVVCGIHYGKVRAMYNDRGMLVESAPPSIPVEVIGLSGVPNAGDELLALEDDKAAKQVSIHRMQKQRAKDLAKSSRVSLEKLFEKMQEEKTKVLNIIIKADVQGSIEALRDSLLKLSNEEVRINIVHCATGTITESDVSLATVSDAIIIGFNVRPTTKAQSLAAEEHVDIRYHNIIYNVIKEVQDAIVGMMESTFVEKILGRAEIREVFHVPKVGAVAGSYVLNGKIQRGRAIRLIRDGVVIYNGKISSLKRFKDDVKEVVEGYECGIGIENYNDIKIGDIIECYFMEEIKPEIESISGDKSHHSENK